MQDEDVKQTDATVDDSTEDTPVIDLPSSDKPTPSGEPEMLTKEQAEKLADERHSKLDKEISDLRKAQEKSTKSIEAADKRAKAAEEALRESEETARALLNAPTESALLLDTSGAILALNRPAADAFAKNVDELVGLCAFDQFSSDIAERRKAHHDKVVRSGKAVRYEDEREGRWWDTNVYPIIDAQGKVGRVAIFSRDVTEQKRAQEDLKHAKEKLTRYSKDLESQVKERTKERA